MTLDTSERWLGGDVDLVFVEPCTGLLRSLLRPGDDDRVTIHEQTGSDVDHHTFEMRWFQDDMWHHHRQLLEARLPLMAKSSGGNIWLQMARARA